MQKGKKFLSDLKLYSDYFKWMEDKGRYENWEDACENIIDGHRKKYVNYANEIEPYLQSAVESMKDQVVLASQRNLQYRYEQIMKHNTRMFNCTSGHIARNRVFQEIFYLALSGCGFGGGLLIPFVKNLSKIQKRNKGTKTFVISDSIEGWADSLGLLLSSYFVDNQPFPEYAGYEVKFDYSQIREKGAYISGGFKAPGYDGLKQSLERIEQLIEKWIEKEGNTIRPILAFDIICHSADAVLSGGVRRSALNMIVDPNDDEMIHAKTGNWRMENPQRARSNNSVILLRSEVKKDQFEYLVKLNDGANDIGFVFANSWFDMFNPCVSDDTLINTPKGLYFPSELTNNNQINLNSRTFKSTGFKETGIKPLYEFETIYGRKIKVTGEHVMFTDNGMVSASQLQIGDKLIISNNKDVDIKFDTNSNDFKIGYLLGSFLGDGNFSNKYCQLKFWGNENFKYHNKCLEFLKDLGWSSKKKENLVLSEHKENYTLINTKELFDFIEQKDETVLYEKALTKKLISGSFDYINGIISGYFDADGTVLDNTKKGRSARIVSVQKENLENLQIALNAIGIYSKIYSNRNRCLVGSNILPDGKGGNKEYKIKDSYELVITNESLKKFLNVGFINFEKRTKLESLLSQYKRNFNKTKYIESIKSITYIQKSEKVYDCSVEFGIESFECNGFAVHNCFEILKIPVLMNVDFSKIHYNDIEEFVKTNQDNFGIQGCVSYDTKIITRNGIEIIGKVVDENRNIEVWNGENWSKVKPILTGKNRKLYRVKLNDGSYLDCTENHKWLVKNRFEKEFKEIETKELIKLLKKTKYKLQVPRSNVTDFNFGYDEVYAYDYGFVLGDGTCPKIGDKYRTPFASVYETNFSNEYPFVEGIVGKKLKEQYNGIESEYYNVTFNKLDKELSYKLKYEQGLPSEIFNWSKKSIIAFVAGWIDTDGTITYNNKARIYGEESKIRDLQLLLTKVGINSSVNLCSKNGTKTNFGVRNKDLWYAQISDCGDLWSTKTRFEPSEVKYKGKYQCIDTIEELDGLHNSYCFEEQYKHQGLFNNVLTKQCNLTEINAEKCTTKEKFLKACRDASILGTLQAGYTDFPYLGETSKKIFEREALLGVSITGWMNNPKLFNPELLEEGANVVKDTNKEVSFLIEINQAARTTCVKPSGNASVVLGTASGIHPEHSEKYFRIMQLNKESNTAKWLTDNMPFLLEDSVWSSTKSDYVVFVPVENPKQGLFKKDMKGIKHLELIKLVQQHWVNAGTNPELCVYSPVNHNTSCTVIIDDKNVIIEYIWENKDFFTAVSFISDYGDKDFNQAPFTSVLNLEEIVAEYGKGAILASGLVVDGLHYFENNLWLACDTLLDSSIQVMGTREQVLLKNYWISRAKKFAKNFFKGDMRRMVYCLKDVHLFHKWETVSRQFKEVNFGEILDKPQYKDISDYAAQSCAGAACDITKI
jgi:hypothetical protein